MDYTLPETNLVQIKTLEKLDNKGTFVIEPLSPGYGVTIGNSLRRVLLSSLEGSAIASVKITGATHQFSTIAGIKEDIVEIILNLKTLRFKMTSTDPVALKLSVKGPKTVTAADFDSNPNCEVVNKDTHLATLSKGAKLDMEIIVKKGRGYEPVEQRKEEKLPIGTIAVDSIFTPVKKVHFEVDHTRVGEETDFDKLVLEITTDGSIDPEAALNTAAKILVEHLGLVNQATTVSELEAKELKPKKIVKKAIKKVKTVK